MFGGDRARCLSVEGMLAEHLVQPSKMAAGVTSAGVAARGVSASKMAATTSSAAVAPTTTASTAPTTCSKRGRGKQQTG